MAVRTVAALAVLAAIGSAPLCAQQKAAAKVGDQLVIRMTGELAKEYARRTGSLREKEVPAGLEVETIAAIAQRLDDGRIRIEHTSNVKRDGNKVRLVTLTAIVDSTKITTDITPKGTPIYASPAPHKNGAKPTLTAESTKTLRLHLSELKGLKLRTWSLVEEIGD